MVSTGSIEKFEMDPHIGSPFHRRVVQGMDGLGQVEGPNVVTRHYQLKPREKPAIAKSTVIQQPEFVAMLFLRHSQTFRT